MKPGRPPPLFIDMDGVGVSEDCLLYVDLPKSLQVDSLKKFVSEAGGVSVSGITFSTKPGVALVKYMDAPGELDYIRMTLSSSISLIYLLRYSTYVLAGCFMLCD